jgi:hypothetical protein
MAEHPQFAVGRPGNAREQVDECRRLRPVISQDAEDGLARVGRPDAEARRAHSPGPPPPHADASSDDGIRAYDSTAGRHAFPRI